jgi:hypothetical protein
VVFNGLDLGWSRKRREIVTSPVAEDVRRSQGMEEQTASGAAGFNTPRTLQREILEPGHRPVDPRERLRQHRAEIRSAYVKLVMAHLQQQIAPAFGRETLADRVHLVDEWSRWSERGLE